jgi:chaperonin GroEL
MPAKRFLFGEAGRARLLAGTRALAGAVKATLGPGGRTVLLQRPMFAAPLVTKDGVTVAEEIELADEFENMGAQLMLESAIKTSSVAGDGTTTATVLAHFIYREGVKLVAAGHHPMALKRGIDLGVELVAGALAKMSKRLKGGRDVARVATISANGDAAIGKLIAEAVGKVGLEGIIHVEQGQALETTLEVSEGVEIDRGYSSGYFITDKERLVVRLEDPYLLLCLDKISDVQTLIPILEKVRREGRSVLVVAELLGEALSLLVVNQLQGTLKVCAIMPPDYGEARKRSLGDMAAQTGASIVTDDGPVTLANVTLADLGRAHKIVVDQEKTTIVGGAARKAEMASRARAIREEYEATNSTFKHQELDRRLRRLVGGAALLKVGGTTDPEVRERKLRIEDALFATRAAIEEGIVAGGGVALVRAAAAALAKPPRSKKLSRMSEDEAAGFAIVRRACEEPCRQIAGNAGANVSLIAQRVRDGKGAFGYNAARDRLEDLLAAGVIDPTKVVRLALQNAASIAGLLLTSEALIADAPRDAVDWAEQGDARDAMSVEPILSRRR